MTIEFLPGIRAIADEYDGFIVDVWGVLHDGGTAYPGAIDCLRKLKQTGKRAVLLSNAPRPAADVVPALAALGYEPSLYSGIMTSGEEVRRHLRLRDDPWYAALGRLCYLLGPGKDLGMLEGIQAEQARTIEDADFILNTGADFDETVEDYRPLMTRAIARGLPMICANPDLVVVHYGVRQICAGAIAVEYERLGGAVRYHGKPHPSVYQSCFALLGVDDRARIAAIGDGLGTDIKGAAAAGIDGFFVTQGIHAADLGLSGQEAPDPAALAELCAAAGVKPRGALGGLVW
jgi:HAD superfamily hydrolase (TIGR01459 family)